MVLLFLLVLSGSVRDSTTKTPLPGAVVRVVHTTLGAAADHHGLFHIHNVEGDSVDVEVSCIGYEKKALRVAAGANVVVDLKPTSLQTGEVVIRGERGVKGASASQNTESLNETVISEVRTQTLGSLLQNIPGVTTKNTGPAVAKPVIHGLSGQRIVITNAGVAQEGQQWGDDHGPEIDPFVPARISVIKGPSSVMYGPNAMGGVVRVDPSPFPNTRDVAANNVDGEISANLFANNGQGAIGGQLELQRIVDEPMNIRVFGSARQAGNSRTPDYFLENTGFEQWNVGLNAEYWSGVDRFFLNTSSFNSTIGVFEGSHVETPEEMAEAIGRGRPETDGTFTYDVVPPKQEIHHLNSSFGADVVLDSTSTLELLGGLQSNKRSEFDEALEPEVTLNLITASLDAGLNHQWFANSTGKIGISVMNQQNRVTGASFIVPDYSMSGGGVYLYESFNFTKHALSFGVRGDGRWLNAQIMDRNDLTVTEQSKFYGSFSGSVGWRRYFSESASFTLNATSAWRPPNPNELYSNDVHHGIVRFEVGDSTLNSEVSIGGEGTVSLKDKDFEFSTTMFGSYFFGYIVALPDPDNPTVIEEGTFPTYRYTQFDAKIGGIDFTTTFRFSEEVSTTAIFSWVSGTSIANNQPLFNMPPLRGRVGVHLHEHDILGLHEVFADASVLGVARQREYVDGSDYVPPPPGYVLFDVSVGAHFPVFGVMWKLSASCTNIFNKVYRDYLNTNRYFADDPGRDLILRLTIPFHEF